MATGMAIMGFGGGAFIASPLSVWLMAEVLDADPPGHRRDLPDPGRRLLRVHDDRGGAGAGPRPGLCAGGGGRPAARTLISTHDVYVYDALRTPQFWLLWGVLCMNVTAGIGVLGQASAMSQEIFPGRVTAVAAAGFVGLLSLFNMVGRFFWASTSDVIGRRNTYFCFFILGIVLYSLVPGTGAMGSVALFVACSAVIISACMAAALPPSPPTCATCSAPATSAPSRGC